MEELAEIAERVEDEEIDVATSNSILTIKRGIHTIVINTQTPNRQLWYSCTLSGPQRFDWQEGKWLNNRAQDIDSEV
jgi:frataxin